MGKLTPLRALFMGMALGGLLVGLIFLILLGTAPAAHRVTRSRITEPAFRHLENQLSQPVSSESFQHRIEVVSFISPYCREECPLVAHHYAEYARAIREAGWQREVVLLSFNLDPRRATPAVLQKFQQIFGWNPHDLLWEFLTGPPSTIDRLVKSGFKVWFGFAPNSTEPGSPPPLHWINPLNPTGAVPNPAHQDPLEVYGPHHHLDRFYQDGSLVSAGRLMKKLFHLVNPQAVAKRI